MDRMSYIPGAEARREVEDANGHIFFTKETALDYVDEFLSGGPPILYQVALASLSDGDRVDIKFDVLGPDDAGEGPGGEGFSWATVTESSGDEKLLWKSAPGTESLSPQLAVEAFNFYRNGLADFKNEPTPERAVLPRGIPPQQPLSNTTISCAFSAKNIQHASGIMFYFVMLSTSAPSRADYFDVSARLSRPMRAFDALVLSAMLTLAVGSPPLVFAVLQSTDRLGEMPGSFQVRPCAFVPGCLPEDGTVSIVA